MIWEELSFKVSVYFNYRSGLVQWSKTVSTILIERHLCKMPVKFDWNWLSDIGDVVIYRFFCFKLWQPAWSLEQNHFSYFKQHSCKVRLKLAQWCRRSYHLNIFSIFSPGGRYVHWCGIILSIFVESHIGNIPVKLDWNWPRGVREVDIYGKLLIQHDARRTTHDGHWPITI